MSTVPVFRFRKYDINSDTMVISKRWATPTPIAIKTYGASPLFGSEKLVNESEIDGDGFHPPLTPPHG